MRTVESLAASALVILTLPLLTSAWVGLWWAGTRPVFVLRETERGHHLAFNSTANDFGLLIRRFSVDQLPALFQVIAGKIPLKEVLQPQGTYRPEGG